MPLHCKGPDGQTPPCCSSTRPSEGLAPIIVQEVRDIPGRDQRRGGIGAAGRAQLQGGPTSLAAPGLPDGQGPHRLTRATVEELEANAEARSKYLEV